MEAGMRIRALFARWDSTLMVRTPAGPSPVFEALEPRLLLSAVRADEAWTAGLAFTLRPLKPRSRASGTPARRS